MNALSASFGHSSAKTFLARVFRLDNSNLVVQLGSDEKVSTITSAFQSHANLSIPSGRENLLLIVFT